MRGAGPSARPPSPFLVLVLGAAVTALTTEWLRFQDGWTLAAAPALLGAAATLAGVARSYRARRAWRKAREHAPAGEPHAAAPEPAVAPARVMARPTREEPRPSVLRHDVDASLLGPKDLHPGVADARADRRADAAPEGRAAPRPGRPRRERDRVETD